MASCPIDAVTLSETHTKKNIRHVEKRRTATCAFADRVARTSIDHYLQVVPESERPPQTCLATFVVHDNATDSLKVVGMGVGTKFLSEAILHEEEQTRSIDYGKRLRDCHAEVLARRAFRRQLTLEILQLISSSGSGLGDVETVLEPTTVRDNDSRIKYRLRSGMTLHFYSSSAPCGNATLKKFAKMTKERFRQDLRPDEWPKEPHEPIHGSSIQLGQFSLLLKKDSHASINDNPLSSHGWFKDNQENVPKGKMWQAVMSDDWTPPGTTTVAMTHKGSIHTCSDKISRWNYLGLQGSLLSTLLEEPLYLSTMTVGRKFTSCICRRAICCRMEESKKAKQLTNDAPTTVANQIWQVKLNHPAVLGTAVYMDESGIVETSAEVQGQDVRFHSSKSWCWWPWLEQEKPVDMGHVECIDGASGYLWNTTNGSEWLSNTWSLVSTYSLFHLFLRAYRLARDHDDDDKIPKDLQQNIVTLAHLRSFKRHLSPHYEASKDEVISKHRIFRQWRRREYSIDNDLPAEI